MEKFKFDSYQLFRTTKDIKYVIGLQIRKSRLKRGISQCDLARELGVDQNYISKIECGKVNISIESLFKICYYLDCYIQMVDVEEEKEPVRLTPCLRSKNEKYVEYVV